MIATRPLTLVEARCLLRMGVGFINGKPQVEREGDIYG